MINLFRCIPVMGFVTCLSITVGVVSGPSRAAFDSPHDNIVTGETLRLGTLNIAHGRRSAWNQMLVGGETISRNLEEIGEYLSGVQLDVLALQEIDAPSRWSGQLDQPALLSRSAGLPHLFYGSHADSFLFDYGTAMISRVPLADTYSQAFAPSPPTPDKGFVYASISWNPAQALPDPLKIGLISLHLDFSRQSVRQSQLDELIAFVQAQDIPVILMGDFNLEAGTDDAELERLAAVLELQLFEPSAENHVSYPGRGGARLDWILLPGTLQFRQYNTDPSPLSDHNLVWAEVALAEPTRVVEPKATGAQSQ